MRSLSDLARNEVGKVEELCRTTAELAANVETYAKEVDGRFEGVSNTCKELLVALEAANKESAQRDAEFARRLDALEEVIGRIDRNTQKGFGKERAKHAAW